MSYDREVHFHSEPFPHIAIQNALTVDRVKEIISVGEVAKEREWSRVGQRAGLDNFAYARNQLKLYGTKPPRRDYDIESDTTRVYNFLCDEFGYDFMKRSSLIQKNHLNDDIESVSQLYCYCEYDSERCGLTGRRDLDANETNIPAMIPHRDAWNKIFIALLYLSTDEKSTTGGLDLWSGKPGKNGRVIDSYDDVKLEKVFPYGTGNLIIMPNLPEAMHCVSEWDVQPNEENRKMLCLTFDSKNPEWHKISGKPK